MSARGISWRTPAIIMGAGALIALISLGVRSSFGLFLAPMSADLGWGREVFGLALAVQNLVWGLAQPIAGGLADRYGPVRVLTVGGVLYAVGVWLMSVTTDPVLLNISAGLLVGMGIAFSSFTIVIAALAKMVAPEKRSLVMGLGTAAGSMGQVVVVPLGAALLTNFGWVEALFWLSLVAALIIPLASVFAGGSAGRILPPEQSFREALTEAFAHRGYVLLTIGFFVCGFQVAFITVHLPAYLGDNGLGPTVGATALMLVGLCNIAGSFASGWAGGRYSKKYGLVFIYVARSIVTAAYLLMPLTEMSTYAFAIAMGFLWLSTVPLTYGIVGQVFGPGYMAMLSGITFVSHQVGSFIGVWAGGALYDAFGTYDPVWWGGVILGVLAALVHWPIDDRSIERQKAGAAA